MERVARAAAGRRRQAPRPGGDAQGSRRRSGAALRPGPGGQDGKNRIHFALWLQGRTREAEVERAVALGARLTTDRTRPDGRGWVALADPEGNEFCVERGEGD
ncbi:VOC family protein [Streptomyces sp. NPDC050988]|uniref:VOC family protein n=1 Tax=Streptomyces sp. NPDC050988 TaxID=3365637 RepID=UPI0037AD746E